MLRLNQDGAWRWAILWGCAALLAVYTYYGSPMIVGVTALVTAVYLIAGRRWQPFFVLATVGLVAAFLTLPLALDILPPQLAQPSGTAGRPPIPLGTLGAEVQTFLGGVGSILRFQQLGYQPAGWPWPVLPEWVAWLPAMLLLAAGAVRYPRSLPFVWLGTSFLIYFVVSKSGLFPFEGRYSLVIAPLLASCLAAGAAALWARQKAVAVVLGGAIVLVSLLAPPEPPEDLRTVTQAWLAARSAGEPTYVYYGAAPGFGYQVRLAGSEEAASGAWYIDCWLGESCAGLRGRRHLLWQLDPQRRAGAQGGVDLRLAGRRAVQFLDHLRPHPPR